MKNKKNNNEVRPKSGSLLIIFPILCMTAIVLILTHHYFSVVLPLILCIYSILSFLNEKLLYDEEGITFCDFMGKKRFIPWKNIISIEDTYEDPRLSRGVPGRKIKIKYIYKYKNMSEKTEIFKLSFNSYIGIDGLLSFYMNQIHKKEEFPD